MKTLLSKYIFVIAFAVPTLSQAAAPKHGFTADESQAMAAANSQVAGNEFLNGLFKTLKGIKQDTAISTVPFAEWGDIGYVIFSEDTDFNSGPAKKKIAKNLPDGVTLVVYTGNSSESYQEDLFKEYAQYIDEARLKVIYLPKGERGFWARDGIPVPVWKKTAAGELEFNVVDARYYHPFEADQEVASFFNAPLLQHSYFYEGGNYSANSKGDCIVVNNVRVLQMPDSTFQTNYGCKTITRLPHTKGIGHIDESVKFMDDDTLLVDDQDYYDTLKAKGWDVVKMVRPARAYETYVNALIVNGTAFLPTFNEKTDIEAIEIYESFGLKVVPLNSISLSNDGMGSIHCITMAYPPVPFNELLKHIGAK